MPVIGVRCSSPNCRKPATYKIAASWTDGRFSELKTYGHACAEHVSDVFRDAEERRATYSAAPGESVENICIFRSKDGWMDWQLERLVDLEENYRSWGSGPEGV